ncbi:hypothetical protein [Nocardioides alcanivorans]|uniref:hypothetical protein n=1 Tax=Nocardioides alcanivorans TaxID=2897352 RepID=UPI001F4062E9|nr:hypothetical protein [Nocardioides alcanivorans]
MVSGNELDRVELLPAQTNLIHVGPEKTGSTSIQSAFATLRPKLADHGVCYPGNPDLPRAYLEPLGFHGMRGAPPRDTTEWQDLLKELADAADERVLISHEQLGRATDDQMARVVESLGGVRPHVLMVARRYDTYIPSQWQQGVKARITRSYESYLELVMQDHCDDPLWRKVWLPHDTVDQVERWSRVVGMDAVTVVVANDQDHGFLSGVFERLLGLPSGMVGDNVSRSNRSLTYPEVELLRHFVISMNEHDATLEEFHRLMRKGVLRAMQSQPAVADEPRVPPLPKWAMELARVRSERRLEDLRRLEAEGLRVIGDPQRLAIPADAPTSEDISPPTVVSLETAIRANRALAKIELRNHRKVERRAIKAVGRAASEKLIEAPAKRRWFGRR